MYKTFVAGVTALTLTVTTAVPAQASGFGEDDLGKLLFGLFAAAGIAQVIENNQSEPVVTRGRDNVQQSHSYNQPTPRHPKGPRHGQAGNNPRSGGWAHHRVTVPRRCIERVNTRYGEQRIVERRCIRQTTNLLNRLPNQCRMRIHTSVGVRGGWDPRCLRDQGIRISRGH